MIKPTPQQLKTRRHQRETYTDKTKYKFCGSMFFWIYMVLCFSDFNTSIFKRHKELKKKIDTKVLLALEIVRFSTLHNEYIRETKGEPVSYKDLMIVWWLIFDKKSSWNKELRRILEWTGWEHILDIPTPTTYDNFFSGEDDEGIDKVNFNNFLDYLPREMFMDAVALVLKCDKHTSLTIYQDVSKTINQFSNAKILWYRRWLCYSDFRFAVKFFVKKPSQKYLRGVSYFSTYNSDQWLALCEKKEKVLMDKLEWKSNRDLKYIRKYIGENKPSDEKWMETMQVIWQRLLDIENEELKRLKEEWYRIVVRWGEINLIPPKEKNENEL